MQYFKTTLTLQEAKEAYDKAAMALHPDKAESVLAMQELNAEFEIAFALAQKCNRKLSTTLETQKPLQNIV